MVLIAGKIGAVILLAIASQQSMRIQQNQLPLESEIPGERQRLAEDMPSESAIPGESKSNRELPSELGLPPSAARATVDANIKNNVAGDQDDPDRLREFSQRPIFRIRSDGPVASLKSICFSVDSTRIFAGGLDKTLHVWQRLQRPVADDVWAYEKPYDWQINRGNQGQIFSVTAGKKNIIFGGVGASASNGEMILVDRERIVFSQALADVKRGHIDSISSIATDLENQVVASIDTVGRVIVWRRDPESGTWNPETLRGSDSEILGKPAEQALLQWRSRGGAIGLSDKLTTVYPEISQPLIAGAPPNWHLVLTTVDGTKSKLAAPESHRGSVVAIACSSDGRRIVSADLRDSGRLFLWDLEKDPRAKVLKTDFPIRCLDLTSDGTQLMIGTARDAKGNAQTRVLSWNFDGKLAERRRWDGTEDVESCAFSPVGTQLAFTRGAKIVVCDLADGRVVQTLETKMQQASRVAFSATTGDYRCNIRAETGGQSWLFDPAQLNLKQVAVDARDLWLNPNPQPAAWKLKVSNDSQTTVPNYFVEVAGKSFCQLPRQFERVGAITTYALVAGTDDPNTPAALIVGTSGKNHVYVFRIGPDRCEQVREYRGHSAPIASVGVSADNLYLVSAARDSTVCFWKLSQAFENENWDNPSRPWLDRWGAQFTVDGKRLLATNLIEDGPLYFRGVRKNDEIESIGWSNPDGTPETQHEPAAILQQLADAPSDRLIRFNYRRAAVDQPYFYLYPAWQPLASFAWDDQREWAFWTPYGFYDASFNGHKFFGWQINQGVNRNVEFFRAAELKNDLERPKMMQNLLSSGSVESAFKVARSNVPQDLSERLSVISRLQPTVEILQVTPVRQNGKVILTAKIELASGVELGRVKAFANGVPAKTQSMSSQQVTKLSAAQSKQVSEFRFEFELPHDQRIKLQVLAASELGHGAVAETMIDGPSEPPLHKPRIFIMALGVGKYQDSQIPTLDFAQLNADSIFKQIANPTQTNDPSLLLTEDAANKSMWLITSRWLSDEMKRTARPDDLLVLFLSGHGFRDPVNEDYFFLTADSKYADVMARRYDDCISFDELSGFGEVGCRKLVILDTCHSGALQALRQQNLKSVVRTLENDLFFTLTASEGSQVAFESKQRGLGLFTARLIEGLSGQSDVLAAGGNGDGVVSLRETIQYLKATVPNDAAQLGNYQFPTASPADLLELAEINLSALDN